MDVISKKQMSEEDIKLHYITPAITAQWNIQHITMETKVTDGRINLKGNLVIREKPKRADYVLYVSANNPIAIVEAKDNNHAVSYGLQQAMTYAQMLDVPFAYSSNGDGFMEHDFLTGKEREFGLDEFPTEQELIQRYKAGANGGAGLTPEQEKIIAQPYYSSQNTYPPRYYQRVAVNRTLDAIARGQNRILLVMATGTGKTYTIAALTAQALARGRARFADPAWVYGDSRPLAVSREARFTWGLLRLDYSQAEGSITQAALWSDGLEADFLSQVPGALQGCPRQPAAVRARLMALKGAERTLVEDILTLLMEEA